MSETKILPLEAAAEQIGALKRGGKTIVQCHGCFDLLHVGHIKHLQAARRLGDLLIVTVTPDQHVGKGAGRPVFSARLRAEALAALDCVDFVVIDRSPTAVDAIRLLRPDYYVKGQEFEALRRWRALLVTTAELVRVMQAADEDRPLDGLRSAARMARHLPWSAPYVARGLVLTLLGPHSYARLARSRSALRARVTRLGVLAGRRTHHRKESPA